MQQFFHRFCECFFQHAGHIVVYILRMSGGVKQLGNNVRLLFHGNVI